MTDSPTPPAHLPEARLAEIEARIAQLVGVLVYVECETCDGSGFVFDGDGEEDNCGECFATGKRAAHDVAASLADLSALVLAVRAARAEIARMRVSITLSRAEWRAKNRDLRQDTRDRIMAGAIASALTDVLENISFPAGGGDDR